MNILSVLILISLMVVVLAAPSRWALLGMAAGVLYLTEYAAVEALGFNMFAMRFLEIAGFARIIMRREYSFSNPAKLDRLILLFYSFVTIVFLLRSDKGQAYQIGAAVDALLCYFTFRGLISTIDDLRWFLHAFAFILIPYVACLYIEMHTGHSPLSMLGGNAMADGLRNGLPRCVGSFREPALLGSLGASVFPLYLGLIFSDSDRRYAIAGILLSLAIVGFSNSGAPLTVVVSAALGWLLWPWRRRMGLIKRLGLAGLVVLALVMKSPIWYLPTHFSIGGDAWHRSYLIEVAINHIGQWWLWGMPLSKTSEWFPYRLALNGQADITNQFIVFGLNAGIIAIILFVLILVRTFRSLSDKMAELRLGQPNPCKDEYILWGLGVMLVGHILNFFAISYFDQIYVIWFMQLAFVASITDGCALVPMQAASIRTQPV